MTLLQAGSWNAFAALAAGALLAVVAARTAPRPDASATRASRWIAVLALLLCTTLLPAIDTTLLSQDASVHRAAGRWLQAHGTLGVPDPSLERLDPQVRYRLFNGGSLTDKRASMVRIPGGMVIPDITETVAYPSFSHLLSIWVAISIAVFGSLGPSVVGFLFAFSAWWAIGLIAWRDGRALAAVAALALLASWLPEHWFARFLMPEILAQALVWCGVGVARFSMEASGLDRMGRPAATPRSLDRRAGWTAGVVAGLSLGVAAFARLEQFWVFIPALLLVRVFAPASRWVLPPGALAPLLVTGVQGLFHLWWIPTDYGNRIYKSAQGIYRSFVLTLFDVLQGDGHLLTFLLNRVLPVAAVVGVLVLLWWGRRLDRRTPGAWFRPLIVVVAGVWLFELYARGLPDSYSVLVSTLWYIPWPVFGAVLIGLPSLATLPGLEIALLLESLDQIVWGRVSPEHIWASRRLVTVALPVLSLAAVRGAFGPAFGGAIGRFAARAAIVVAVVVGFARVAPMVGVPFQAGGHAFVADFAENIPKEGTVVLVQPLDWLHLGSALWLGEGRHTYVMREEGYPGFGQAFEEYLLGQMDRPVFVVAGAVVGPDGGDDETSSELARLPDSIRLERLGTHVWTAPTLEVTFDRMPTETVERRAFLHLYRARLTTEEGEGAGSAAGGLGGVR